MVGLYDRNTWQDYNIAPPAGSVTRRHVPRVTCHVSEHYLLYLVSGLARKVETLLVRAAKQQHFGTTILKWEKHGVNEVSLELQTIHWFS